VDSRETGPENEACLCSGCFLIAAIEFFPVILITPLAGLVFVLPAFGLLLYLGLEGLIPAAREEMTERKDWSTNPPNLPWHARSTAAQSGPRRAQMLVRSGAVAEVQVLRGGELVGNRFRYKVKVLNKSKYVITDVTVSLVSYPRDALSIENVGIRTISKIQPSGFVSPTFVFLPTRDCVKGDIIANVSYVDYEGKARSVMAEPFTIRAVCDLLAPERITPEDFELRLENLDHGEMALRVDDWTPEEMQSKSLQVLEKSNFSEVGIQQRSTGAQFESRITGWARGKYTGKNLGVEIDVSGRRDTRGATCKIRMSGQDEAMILPAIDEMSHSLSAWLCPVCAGELPNEAVDDIKAGRQAKCPFCAVALER
jgi:hypothetical protein